MFCLERVGMKLLEYLKSLDDDLNFFIICINAGCEAFARGKEGTFDLDDAEEMTFFRTYARNILKSSKAAELLKDIVVVGEWKEEEAETVDNIIFITVNCKENYDSIKEELTEILN